jgi:hypothetical protein
MPKVSNKEEVAGENATPVRYWSPENENLILDGNPQVKFDGFAVEVGDPAIIKRLDASPWKGKDFFKVHDKSGDDQYKARFMSKIRGMVLDDPADQVKQERGFLALLALFTQPELDKHGISRSVPDIDRLILAVINNKYVEGIV